MRYIQHRVGTVADGIYGRNTEAAIKRFQQQNGLTADGIVGAATWQKLVG
jgi:N-acetylmuramoyl-L-alanine amidase